jgi:plastocyanin
MVGPNGTFTFQPSTLTIYHGDTVTWMWTGNGHTVTSGSACNTSDNKFCSQGMGNCSTFNTLNTGATYVCSSTTGVCTNGTSAQDMPYPFSTPGTYPYHCAPHCGAGMTGAIIVK